MREGPALLPALQVVQDVASPAATRLRRLRFAGLGVVAVIEVDEGVRMAAGLRDVDPAALELDQPVEVEMVGVSETAAVPFFRLAR